MTDLGPSFLNSFPATYTSGTALPAGWEEYHFAWAGPKGRYFYHAPSSLLTTFDVRLLQSDQQMSAVFDAKIAYAMSVKATHSHQEVIFSPSENAADPSPKLLGVVDHSRLTIKFDHNPVQLGPDYAYAQYVQFTTWSHLDTNGIIITAATSVLIACLEEHQFSRGLKLIFTEEQATTLLDLLQVESPRRSSTAMKVLESYAWVFLREPHPKPKFFYPASMKAKPFWFDAIAAVPFLRIPYQYRERLHDLCRCSDGELPHQWEGFIPAMVNEWTQLNIVLALLLSSNVALLALPGVVNAGTSVPLASSISRGAGLVSIYCSLLGLLCGLVLLWVHQPSVSTSLIRPRSSSGVHQAVAYLRRRNIDLLALVLSFPLLLLVWGVLSFAISASAWSFVYSGTPLKVASMFMLALLTCSPFLLMWYFWGVWEDVESMDMGHNWDDHGVVIIKPKK
ncbi:hypothetical protein BD410DRAFT_781593 [Rickenella mellea]|uniref:WW domain-containing protein n=1 Tax=Rickenella mellea TaxID=50990 RepID=A0A4Y7QJX4_9AGAM|nr:hypothetical protein BD410DRAFT_781593 [Rickenella mellea]